MGRDKLSFLHLLIVLLLCPNSSEHLDQTRPNCIIHIMLIAAMAGLKLDPIQVLNCVFFGSHWLFYPLAFSCEDIFETHRLFIENLHNVNSVCTAPPTVSRLPSSDQR